MIIENETSFFSVSLCIRKSLVSLETWADVSIDPIFIYYPSII
jgi:hypothetical protein